MLGCAGKNNRSRELGKILVDLLFVQNKQELEDGRKDKKRR